MAKEKTSTQPETNFTLKSKGDLTNIIASDGSGQPPSLPGFDPKFRDIVDYILKITNEIWEERGIGRLYDYYSTNIRVHSSGGDIYTREKVIEGTIQALAAFPDRRLYGEEVIWTGDDKNGYYTSHRVTHEGHNWGHTKYGPPTGRCGCRNIARRHLFRTRSQSWDRSR